LSDLSALAFEACQPCGARSRVTALGRAARTHRSACPIPR